MRIRLAILERDTEYLSRIVAAFNAKYADKLQIYSFTDYEIALNTLSTDKIDVFVASDAFEIEDKDIPKRCGFAYFVDVTGIESVKNRRAICKFQKADLIYKQILSIYSENASDISGLKLNDTSCEITVFTSPSGGSGCSTIAASAAINFAMRGKKVLYLNLEKFGSTDVFFSEEGQFDMSDIIYSLKSKKMNLALKLESCAKQDSRNGVYFFSQPKVALDMMELRAEEILHLISELELSGIYENIVIDMDFGIEKDFIDVYKKAKNIVLVGDGSEISNIKITRAFDALLTLEETMDISLTNRFVLIYNKFNNQTSSRISNDKIRIIGTAPVLAECDMKRILGRLSVMQIYDELI